MVLIRLPILGDQCSVVGYVNSGRAEDDVLCGTDITILDACQ